MSLPAISSGVAMRSRKPFGGGGLNFLLKSYIFIEPTKKVWYNTNNWGQIPVSGLRTTPRKGTTCKMQPLKCQLNI
jgi:hypothetical protein